MLNSGLKRLTQVSSEKNQLPYKLVQILLLEAESPCRVRTGPTKPVSRETELLQPDPGCLGHPT